MSSVETIAIVLGRKGSKGVVGKNTMPLLGRPAMDYSLLAAQNSRYVSEIYITTDDEEIMTRSKKFGAVTIDRPPELCTDDALFEDALIHGYHHLVKMRGMRPDIVVILMCAAVTVNAEMIDEAVNALISNREADSAVTVSRFNMYSPLRARRLDAEGYLNPFVPLKTFGNPETLNCDRDSQGDVYFADMSHSVTRSYWLEHVEEGLLPQRWMGQKILPVYNTFGCDIDEVWQVDTSIRWLLNHGFTEETTPYD